jgi:hypothetical protein
VKPATEPSAAIRLDGVTKVFDDGVVAVDDVPLAAGEGECFSRLGPSGCALAPDDGSRPHSRARAAVRLGREPADVVVLRD